MRNRSATSKNPTSNKEEKAVWRKVLYENQGVPDNYVDKTFLKNLRKNDSLQRYTFLQCAFAASRLTNEICLTFIFIVTFIYLNENRVSPVTILSLVSSISVTVFTVLAFARKSNWTEYLAKLKDVAVFLAFGFGFSPLLKTLTETISTDTIYAMVTVMLLFHLLFQDYGVQEAIVSGTLSMNASFFAAVCLASRLPTTIHAFTLLTISGQIFAIAPFLHQYLPTIASLKQACVTAIFVGTTALLLSTVSLFYTVLFGLLVMFINVACPALFIYCQKFKTNIYGPWDEAIVIET